MSQAPLDPKLAQQAVDTLARFGGNQTKAYEHLGLSKSTFQNRLKAAARIGVKAPDLEADLLDEEKLAAKDQIRALKGALAKSQRDNITAEHVRKHIIGLAEMSPTPPNWLIDAKRNPHGIAGVPSVMWSDWHWGEVVDPAQINGINEYNIAIARRRLKSLVEHTIDLCFNHMTGAKYPGIVVNLGGDMISGDIHEELSESNELPSMPTLLDLWGNLQWAISQLADRFGKVFVPCVVGNHGRNTRKPRAKNRVYSNFDWLLYQFLEKHFERDPRVQFLIPTGVDAHYRVYGHRYLLTHGDSIGGRGGDGWSGMVLPVMKGNVKTRISSSRLGQDFDTMIMGHWHQYWPTPAVIVNGCLKGYDEYAKVELRASPEAPAQALWFTHPKYGITCHWRVLVDGVQQPQQRDWVTF